MKLPKQAKPVMRKISKVKFEEGVNPSDCGCEHECDGICLFGTCLGYCR